MNSYNATNSEPVSKISKDIFENLKSNFFIRKILECLHKKKSLEIVKYNKNIKRRINLNINNYKEYAEKYSSIEIEIKLGKTGFRRFININKEDKLYFHIYFNNNKEEEIKREYVEENENIETIGIIIDYQVKSFRYLFYFCDRIESICFKQFFRNNINDMSHMFHNCISLKELDISNFNSDNVINLGEMFRECFRLEKINLSKLNTINVTDFERMFYSCDSLKELDLFYFNTSKVTDMESMFNKCVSLEKI